MKKDNRKRQDGAMEVAPGRMESAKTPLREPTSHLGKYKMLILLQLVITLIQASASYRSYPGVGVVVSVDSDRKINQHNALAERDLLEDEKTKISQPIVACGGQPDGANASSEAVAHVAPQVEVPKIPETSAKQDSATRAKHPQLQTRKALGAKAIHIRAIAQLPQVQRSSSIGATVEAAQIQTDKLSPGQNRSIVLVHVGKAGGTSIRMSNCLKPNCLALMALPESANMTKLETNQRKGCFDLYRQGQRLSIFTHKSIFHMFDRNVTAMEQATSFLVLLRNPVDRLISALKYSHPKNCLRREDYPGEKIIPNLGCLKRLYARPDQIGSRLFEACFPSAAFEHFAQSIIMPYNDTSASASFHNLTETEQAKCREMAWKVVKGYPMDSVVSHAQYNYEHYAKLSVQQFPRKEVFGIRTEHEWDDFLKIDVMIGGSGEGYVNSGKHEKWGSQHYTPSPISTGAYYKLCCVLEKDISTFLEVYNLAINLNETEKEENNQKLRGKCGIHATTSWDHWRSECERGVLPRH